MTIRARPPARDHPRATALALAPPLQAYIQHLGEYSDSSRVNWLLEEAKLVERLAEALWRSAKRLGGSERVEVSAQESQFFDSGKKELTYALKPSSPKATPEPSWPVNRAL